MWKHIKIGGKSNDIWSEVRRGAMCCFLHCDFYVVTLHPLMKRKCLILCAMSITLSCHAQFYSFGGDLERPNGVVVTNPQSEQKESLSVSDTTSLSQVADPVVDFKQQILDLWTSVSMPLDKMKVTSQYGMRNHPIYHRKMPHNGMDFGVPVGTKVYAMMEGVVRRVGYDNRSGNYIVIDHGDYSVSYCHLSKVLVKKGEQVRAGQVTSLSGDTGKSTGPHVHYALRDKNGKWCNPKILLDLVDKTRKTVLELIRQHGGLDA